MGETDRSYGFYSSKGYHSLNAFAMNQHQMITTGIMFRVWTGFIHPRMGEVLLTYPAGASSAVIADLAEMDFGCNF